MRHQPERLSAPETRSVDRIIADAETETRKKLRAVMAALDERHAAAKAEILKIDPFARVADFGAADPAMSSDELRTSIVARRSLLDRLEAMPETLRRQLEDKRRAKLSDVALLREDMELLREGMKLRFAAQSAEIAALRARRPGDVPAPSHKPDVPPMVMPENQRGGGVINKFFGNEVHTPARGGVRRIG